MAVLLLRTGRFRTLRRVWASCVPVGHADCRSMRGLRRSNAVSSCWAQRPPGCPLRPRLPPRSVSRRVLRQQTFGSARVDYVLEREGGGLLLLEVGARAVRACLAP